MGNQRRRASDKASKRLTVELRKWGKDPLSKQGFSAGPPGDDMLFWQATIPGPAGTPFEGATFNLDIRYPSSYPFKGPTLMFHNPPYHPNFNDGGAICFARVNEQWAPNIMIGKLLQELQNFIANPEPSHPLRAVIAEEYINNRAEWEKKARAEAARMAAMGASLERDVRRVG